MGKMEKHGRRPKPGCWHPLWLRTPVLCAFALLFLLLALMLVLVRQLVVQQNGLPLNVTKNHYVWTYGPTVVLVFVVSFWRRVNYCVLVNQPWEELYRGPHSAARTVLLDYLWPLQISSFITAIKFRHFAVAASIAILTLLKVAIVVSTTLFIPQDTHFVGQFQTTQDMRFEPNSARIGQDMAQKDLDGGQLSDPVWHQLNLKREYGTQPYPATQAKAFTNFTVNAADFLGQKPLGTAARVDMLHVEATCEILDVTESSGGYLPFNSTLATPSCNLGTLVDFLGCPHNKKGFLDCKKWGDAMPLLFVKKAECEDGSGHNDMASLDQSRYVVTAADIDIIEKPRGDSDWYTDYVPSRPGHIKRLAMVSCGMEYSVHDGIAHAPTPNASRVESLQSLEAKGPVGNWTGTDLMDIIFASLQHPTHGFHNEGAASGENGAKALLGLITGSTLSTDISSLLTAAHLQREVEDVLFGVAHQVMRKYFLVPDGRETRPATINFTEQRLHVRTAAFGAMVGLFISCCCLVVFVIRYTQVGVAPPSPSTLITSASTLSRSPAMMQLLRTLGSKPLGRISEYLCQYQFVATPGAGGYPCINVEKLDDQDEVMQTDDAASQPPARGKWDWMPYSSKRHAITLTLVLPIFTIAALEALWHSSVNDSSFVSLASDSGIGAYAIRYSSTATVLLIATLFNALDFSIATMTPISCLAAKDAEPERTVLFNMVEDIMPVALFKAIRFKHGGAAFSILASTIGSGLTIIVSGLWVFTDIQLPAAATAQVQAGWNINFTAPDPGTSLGAERLSELAAGSIVSSNLVRDTLVFPTVSSAHIIDSQNTRGQEQQYHIVTSAVEPVLECTVLPDSAFAVKKLHNTGYDNVDYNFVSAFELPVGCNIGSSGSNTYRGALVSVTKTSDSELGLSYTGEVSYLNVTSNNAGRASSCPSLSAVFASHKMLDEAATGPTNSTAVMCNQRLRSVKVNATYAPSPFSQSATLLDFFRIKEEEHGDDENANADSYLADGVSGLSSLSYNIDAIFNNGVYFERTFDESLQTNDVVGLYGRFLTFVMTGGSAPMDRIITPRSNEELLNPDILITSINALYQQLMIHTLDNDLRRHHPNSTADENTWTTIIEGNTDENTNAKNNANPRAAESNNNSNNTVPVDARTTMTVSRLKINRSSKIALQGMLGAMALLGALAYWLTDMRGVIPRNPYPIASKMAFFESSRFLDKYRDDDEKMMTAASSISGGHRFRLGWWSDSSSGGTKAQGERATTSMRGKGRGERSDEEEEEEERSNDTRSLRRNKDFISVPLEEEGEANGSQVTLVDNGGETRGNEALVGGRRFGIDVLEEGICSSGWAMVERKVPNLEQVGEL